MYIYIYIYIYIYRVDPNINEPFEIHFFSGGLLRFIFF